MRSRSASCIHYTSRRAAASPEAFFEFALRRGLPRSPGAKIAVGHLDLVHEQMAIFRARDLACARTRTCNRRGRRRSERHRDLFAGRRPIRLFAVVDRVPDAAVHGGDPDRQRGHRLGYAARACRQHRARAAALGAVSAGGIAASRQHHQHRRRSGGHGRSVAPGGRRFGACLCGFVRDRMPRHRGTGPLSPLCRLPEADDSGAAVLCRGGLQRAHSLGRGGARNGPADRQLRSR